MTHKRERDLYYNCDEKWGPNHPCKVRLFMLIAEDDDVAPNPPPLSPDTLPDTTSPDSTHAQINFQCPFKDIDTRSPSSLWFCSSFSCDGAHQWEYHPQIHPIQGSQISTTSHHNHHAITIDSGKRFHTPL